MNRYTRWVMADAGLRDNTALRYVLGKPKRTTWQALALHIALASAYIAMLLILVEQLDPHPGTASEKVRHALFIPTVAAQTIISAGVFAFTLHVISTLRRKQAWDQLRATAGGTEAAVRAAWGATVYYRIGGWLGVLVYAPRIVLTALLLWDLTGFRGDYLMLIAGGHSPPIPAPLEIVLMGAFLAAGFLLPLTSLGMEAAAGLLLSTFARTRSTAAFIQIGLTAGRVAWAGGVLLLVQDMLGNVATGQTVDPLGGWLVMLGNGALADWGFGTLHAGTLDTLWAAIPYAAYVGVALLGVSLIQSALTEGLLRWAARRAQRME